MINKVGMMNINRILANLSSIDSLFKSVMASLEASRISVLGNTLLMMLM